MPDEEPTFESWIEQTPYDEGRRQQLREAHWSLNAFTMNRKARRRRFKQNKSFCKDEPYDKFNKPRLINSRVDEAKVEFGPWFQKISDALFALPPFIKYVPFKDRPEVIKRDLMREGNIYVSDDFEAFEAHFDKLHMEIEFKLYKYMMSKTAEGRRVFKEMFTTIAGKNECKFQHFKVVLEATRMSGEMNTSLGNSYCNLIIHAYWYWVNRGRPTDHSILREYIMKMIKVEGDDSSASYSEREHIPSAHQLALAGFRVEHLEFDNLGDMSFCGCVFDPDEMIVVTDPLKVLASFGWVPRRYVRAGRKMKLELMRAKALSYKYQYNGCPIITTFVDNIIRQTEGITIRKSIINSAPLYERELLRESINSKLETVITGPKTRNLVERLYNISWSQQLAIEAKLCAVTGPFSLPLVDHLIRPAWRRTARSYTSPYYDGVFRCDVPLGNAAQTLRDLQTLVGVKPTTFTGFTLTGNVANLPAQNKIVNNDESWSGLHIR